MAFLRFSRTYRSLPRFIQILTVLSRHGFGHLVDSINLGQYIPYLSRIRLLARVPESSETLGQRLVAVMEELGPTAIKIGQMLSGRPDLIPDALVRELKKLQDQVPPFDSDQARETIEQELGKPVSELFSSFGHDPLASGSIGQAHEATLLDGTDVIVKVRRPGIERLVIKDIDILHNLAQLAERYVEELRAIHPVMIVEEFSRSLRKELDFVTEATYTYQFKAQLDDLEGVTTPAVFWELTTSRVLVIEKLPGENIGNLERLTRLGVDRQMLASTLASAFMRQYFESGLFHADPHPGNLLVDDQGVIGLIDFGMVGHLTPTLKGQLASVVLALIRGDLELIVQIYTDIGAFAQASDLEDVKSDLLELLDKYFGVPLDKVNAGNVFTDLTRIARQNDVVLPRDFVMLGKSIVTVATLCRDLDPQFSLAQAARPHLWPILREKFSPLKLINQAALQIWNLNSLLQRLPGDAKLLLQQARRGEFRIIQRYEGLEPLSRSIERGASRLAIAMLAAGLGVGSTLLLLGSALDRLDLRLLLAVAGFLTATMLGFWLMIDVIRTSRHR